MKRKNQGLGFRVQGAVDNPAPRPFLLLFAFLLPLSSFLFAYAVTYRVDPAGGPETLSTEVKESFDAWVALSSKIEVSETEENPEANFQYGDTERFGPDTLSLTVQRQTDTRSILYLISPNAENRIRILLHETGIAIGLTPQIPGTPTPAAPPATTPTASTPTESSEPTETAENNEQDQATFETTPAAPDAPSSEPSSETIEGADTSESGAEQTPTEPQNSSTPETTSEQTSDGVAEPATPEAATPPQTLTTNSVMNPSIGAEDSAELGETERQLVEQLQLFVSEDINRDGAVNFYDLVALSQAFGRSGVNDPADINKDGVIDQSDVDELKKSYTFSDPSETAPGGSTTIPDISPEDPSNLPLPSDPPLDNGAPSNDTTQPSDDNSGE